MSVESNFKKWLEEGTFTDDERKFAEDFDSNSPRAMAFFAGDRAARIETLTELRDKTEFSLNPYMYRFLTNKIMEITGG